MPDLGALILTCTPLGKGYYGNDDSNRQTQVAESQALSLTHWRSPPSVPSLCISVHHYLYLYLSIYLSISLCPSIPLSRSLFSLSCCFKLYLRLTASVRSLVMFDCTTKLAQQNYFRVPKEIGLMVQVGLHPWNVIYR